MNRLIRHSFYLVSLFLSLLLQPFELAETKYLQSSVVENHVDSKLETSFSKLENNLYSLSLIESSDITVSLSELPSYLSNNLQKERATTYHFSRKLSNEAKLYLYSQQRINPGLCKQDIIFPFHYFW